VSVCQSINKGQITGKSAASAGEETRQLMIAGQEAAIVCQRQPPMELKEAWLSYKNKSEIAQYSRF
jgi:hypothetical protein